MAHLSQSFGLSPSHSALISSLCVPQFVWAQTPFSCTQLLRQLPGQKWKEPALQGLEQCQSLQRGKMCCPSVAVATGLSQPWPRHHGLFESQVYVPKLSWQTSYLTTYFNSWISLSKLGISPYTSVHRQCPHCLKGQPEYMPSCPTCSKQMFLKVKSYWLENYVPRV